MDGDLKIQNKTQKGNFRGGGVLGLDLAQNVGPKMPLFPLF